MAVSQPTPPWAVGQCRDPVSPQNRLSGARNITGDYCLYNNIFDLTKQALIDCLRC